MLEKLILRKRWSFVTSMVLSGRALLVIQPRWMHMLSAYFGPLVRCRYVSWDSLTWMRNLATQPCTTGEDDSRGAMVVPTTVSIPRKGKVPELFTLKTFGTVCWTHIERRTAKSDINPRGEEGVWLDMMTRKDHSLREFIFHPREYMSYMRMGMSDIRTYNICLERQTLRRR